MPHVGQSIPHDSAAGHVTGQALFIDDHPPLQGELWVEVAGTPCAAGTLRRVDLSAARAIPGVVCVLTHKDIPGHNLWGPIFHDEPVLVADRISYLGQPVVIIAAVSREAARRARAAVVIEADSAKPILTVEDALAAESFLAPPLRIQRGDVETALAAAPHVHTGVFHNNGQEQFYLESQACIAYPGESGHMKVLSSTQNPTETQKVVAEVLGVPLSKVICECKRMGGAFGGKETQSTLPACFAALVAARTGRSARLIYTKDDDMKITGKRHAYLTRFRVGFDDDGRILALDISFHSNGGAFCDLSTSVLERTMLHADNAYYLPHVRIFGRACKTNLPPNTAFRGFGGPQGIVAIESIIEDLAQMLGRDACDIRRLNLYDDNPRSSRNLTPYGQTVRDHVLPETLDQLCRTADYDARRREILAFNTRSRTALKGIALTPVKFGISFTTKFLNQSSALVNVYTDGSIQVSTGGTEMGQGLNVKIRQIVADEFGVDLETVQMMATSTEKNNNTPPTAASAGTDLNATAAALACTQIKTRLCEFAATLLAAENKDDGQVTTAAVRFGESHVYDAHHPQRRILFHDLCNKAWRARIDMGARAFYATPGIDFDRQTGQGSPFFYYTTGAAVSEVTIDRFTGQVTVDRVDMLMDLGRMINPGVDYGQMIGGFVQGMGWCTTEELRYDDKGKLLSYSPTTYKIPNITDVPKVFNVATIPNPKHQRNILRSKAVGEPPLMLAISVWAAIKHALGTLVPPRVVPLRLPATGEEVLLCMLKMKEGAQALTPAK